MRLNPVPPERLGEELRGVHETIVALMVRRQPQIIAEDEHGALIGPFAAMLQFPRFGVPALRFLAALGTEARLPPAVRETAILTAGACLNARYVVYAHEIGAAVAGLEAPQVAMLAVGTRPPDLGEDEAIAFDMARALAGGKTPPASTYGRAVERLGADGTGELIFLVAGYCLIAMVVNGFDMPAPDAGPPP